LQHQAAFVLHADGTRRQPALQLWASVEFNSASSPLSANGNQKTGILGMLINARAGGGPSAKRRISENGFRVANKAPRTDNCMFDHFHFSVPVAITALLAASRGNNNA